MNSIAGIIIIISIMPNAITIDIRIDLYLMGTLITVLAILNSKVPIQYINIRRKIILIKSRTNILEIVIKLKALFIVRVA
ncbi:MAG: hypothetical protein ACTSUJ_09180 [Candidatus Njordarchaeales archaeon]